MFKGAIGEIMRPTGMWLPSSPLGLHLPLTLSTFSLTLALKFIECMCGCGLPLLLGHPVLDMWQSVVEDNLPHTEETIRVMLQSKNAMVIPNAYHTVHAYESCGIVFGIPLIVLMSLQYSQESAVSAFSCLCDHYYSADPDTVATVQGTCVHTQTRTH